jgi:dihydrofolate reductase
MEGGTMFHLVTGGIRDTLERAREAAGGKDVRIGGGSNTIQQYRRERLIDELHIAIAPVLLGDGERLFEGVDLRASEYRCVMTFNAFWSVNPAYHNSVIVNNTVVVCGVLGPVLVIELESACDSMIVFEKNFEQN